MKPIVLCRFVTILFLILFSAQTSAVVIGKDWHQVIDTPNVTYDELVFNSICNPTTGECNGILQGFDFTGWIWATQIEVTDMFESTGIWPTGTWSSPGNLGFSFADAIAFHDIFSPFQFDSNPSILYNRKARGITRTLTSQQEVVVAGVDAIIEKIDFGNGQFSEIDYGFAYTDNSVLTARDSIGEKTGVWIYKLYNIPEPKTFAIFCLGLIALAFPLRRSCASKMFNG